MNRLHPNDYYNQRNNQLWPNSACNVTSLIMALCQAGQLDDLTEAQNRANRARRAAGLSTYSQPEDSLMAHLHTDRWKEHAAAQLGEEYRNRPQEVWGTLVAGANDWMQDTVFHVDWDASLDDIRVWLDTGRGVVFGGHFPGTGGHFVAVGGWTPHGLEINDPWGNYLTGYRNQNGYGVEMPWTDFQVIAHGRLTKAKVKQFFLIIAEPKKVKSIS